MPPDDFIPPPPPRRGSVYNLGFFSRPGLAVSGPFRGRIVKAYRPVRDKDLCLRIAHEHDRYVRLLRRAGFRIPSTEIHTLPHGRRWRLVIVQDAFREEELLRGRFFRASRAEARRLLRLLLSEALRFLAFRERHREPIGFHPTFRNYALRDGLLRYFDTFPPMLRSQEQLGDLVARFAPQPLFRIAYGLSRRWMSRVTDEYYHAVPMLTGIVGSACRLRPDLAEDLLAAGRAFLLPRVKDSAIRSALADHLRRPPRLPGLWVLLRSLIGKEGRPNLR